MKPISLYEPGGDKLNFYCRMCEPIVWQGSICIGLFVILPNVCDGQEMLDSFPEQRQIINTI